MLEDVFFMSTGQKLLLALAALVMVWVMLRLLDRASKFSFKDWIKNADYTDKTIYLCARLIAFCLLVGLVVSS